MSWMLEPIKEGLLILLTLVAPVVITAAGIGLVIGLVQAATQIQDQTIPTALKLVGIAVVLIFFSSFMFGNIREFTNKIFSEAFSVVLENRRKVASPEEFSTKNSLEEEFSSKMIKISPENYIEPDQRTALPPLNSFSAISQAANFSQKADTKEQVKKNQPSQPVTKKIKRPLNNNSRKIRTSLKLNSKKPVQKSVKRETTYSFPGKNSVLLKAREPAINPDPYRNNKKNKRIKPVLPGPRNQKQNSQLEPPTRQSSPEDWW